jgi:hypothetical protein
MEPFRGLIVEPLALDGKRIEKDTHVWIMSRDSDHWRIEYRDKSYTVPRNSVVECPVPMPRIEQLKMLDGCFGLDRSAFEVVLKESDKYYLLLRCKAHGKLFLEDGRGTVFMYSRLIYVGDLGNSSFDHIWGKFHGISDDMLNYMCVAL